MHCIIYRARARLHSKERIREIHVGQEDKTIVIFVKKTRFTRGKKIQQGSISETKYKEVIVVLHEIEPGLCVCDNA